MTVATLPLDTNNHLGEFLSAALHICPQCQNELVSTLGVVCVDLTGNVASCKSFCTLQSCATSIKLSNEFVLGLLLL